MSGDDSEGILGKQIVGAEEGRIRGRGGMTKVERKEEGGKVNR